MPSADADIISMANDIINMLEIKNVELRINSIGCPKCRAEYHKACLLYTSSTLDDLSKAQGNVDNIRMQAKEYVDEAGKARIERDAALKEIEVLKAKIEQLESNQQLKKLKDSI